MMKKVIWILLLASFLCNSVAFATIGVVTQKVLLVRSGPGKDHKVIAKVKRGGRLLVEGLRTNWAKLAWRGEAWVATSGISLKRRGILSLEIDEQFVRWLEGGEPMETNVEDNLRSLALVFAAIESSASGMPVDVQGFIRDHLADG